MAEPAVLERARSEPGSEGTLRLAVERVAGRTRIVDLECSGPIQVLRSHHLDGGAPDIASITMASPAGGVLQGDRLRMDVTVGAGARLVLDTQSATRLYRMPEREARIEARFDIARGGFLEYVPDPWIPFAGSNTAVETTVVAHETATVLLGEVVAAGRVARGEIFAMTSFRTSLVALRPSGDLLFTDATTLEAGQELADVDVSGRASGGVKPAQRGERIRGRRAGGHGVINTPPAQTALRGREGRSCWIAPIASRSHTGPDSYRPWPGRSPTATGSSATS